MTDITFSDISQWQDSFDAPEYLGAGHTVIICRALSKDDGPDKKMPGRRDYVRNFDFDAVGYYNRLNAERDPTQQAREFIDVVGELRANEFPILDLEDGVGNQVSRANAWFDVVDEWAGFMAALYSGAYFFRDNLGGVESWDDRPCWVADYTENGKPNANEEPDGCDWWQFSCTHHFPGLPNGVDANLFHGTGEQFLARVRPGVVRDVMAGVEGGPVVLNHDGRVEVFAADGAVYHRWQTKPGQAFNETWSSLGQPSQGAAMLSTVINKDGRVECFVATKREVLHRWQATKGGGWNEGGWSSLGDPGGEIAEVTAILNHDGRVEVFTELADGAVKHRWQTKPGQGFNPDWSSLGAPA